MSRLLRLTVLVAIFLFLFFAFFHRIEALNQDLGRHLLTGKIILQTNNVPKTNLFSYTFPDFPFINHHWGSEVIFYLIFIVFGFNGLLLSTVIIILSSFLLIILYVFQKSNTLGLAVVSFLYINILLERTDVRPEIFSFLFLSIFVVILYSYRGKFTRWILVLPFLELLWVNAHIYFPIGIAIIGLFSIDYFIVHRKNLNRQYTTVLMAILILSSLATLINPNGVEGALYPLKVFQNYGYSIQENQNILFLWNYSRNPTILFFAISASFLFLILLINLKKTYFIDWLLFLFFTTFATSAIRNFPLFVFATFIPFVRNLSALKVQPSRRLHLIENFSLLLLLGTILFQIANIKNTKTIGFGVEKGIVRALDFFLKNDLKGPLFNNFDIGSYLEYRLYPQEKVFIDGRPEAYPASFFQKTYIPMQENREIFEKISSQYQFGTIFFSHTDHTPWAVSFLRQITRSNNWKIIYLDDYVIILANNNDFNKKLIEKFKIEEADGQLGDFDHTNVTSMLRLVLFYDKIGWTKKKITMYENLLSIKPYFCPALYDLSSTFIREQSTLADVYLARFHSACK